MDWSQSQLKLYRTLLYCCPAEFRHEYGTEMEQLFADRLAFEPAWRLWPDTIADVSLTALREHASILLADSKHTLRISLSEPWFAAITVLVLAVGIAASTAVFTLCNAVLFRSLPYQDPSQLVYLWSPNHNFKGVPDEMGPNLADFVDWQKQSRSFSSMASLQSQPINLVRHNSSVRLQSAIVSGTFFETMDVQPELGRTIAPQDDQAGHDHLADISDQLWRSAFHADPGILGKTIQLGREKATIIGVMPPDFVFPSEGEVPYNHLVAPQTELWVPAPYSAKQKADRSDLSVSFDAAIGRLRPGVPPRQAERELQAMQARVQPLYAPMWRGFSALVRPLTDTIIGPVRQMFWLLLGPVSLVLLIAVANTANLLLARTAARAHELGIRTALGAERGRIMRQLLTESVLLSGTGGVIGLALAYALVHALLRLDPGGIPRFNTASIDERVLGFALLLSILAGIVSGLAPAWLTREADLNTVLKGSAKGIATGVVRSRYALITFEIALSVVLLSSAGLLARSYWNLSRADSGFSRDTLTFGVELDDRYDTPAKQISFYAEALARFQQIPGVRYAGGTDAVPLSQRDSVTYVEIAGQGRIKEVVQSRFVTPDYRKAISAPLLRGRDLSPQDLRPNAAAALVNAAFVRKYLLTRDPLTIRFRLGMGDTSQGPWYTIVGVVGDVKHHRLDEPPEPQIWLPYGRGGQFALAITTAPEQVIQSARKILASLDPVLTLEDIHTLRERVSSSNARRTFQTALLSGFSAVALLLALAGLYGLMSHLVRQRTAEIGLRIALGSPRSRVVAMIVGQGMRITLAGLSIGLICSLALTQLLKSWLFAVNPVDPATLALLTLAVLAASFCGCLFPAWRATRIDPVQALRQE